MIANVVRSARMFHKLAGPLAHHPLVRAPPTVVRAVAVPLLLQRGVHTSAMAARAEVMDPVYGVPASVPEGSSEADSAADAAELAARQKEAARANQQRAAKASDIVEARAVRRHIPMSPQKVGLVAKLVRGMTAERALVQLKFLKKKAAPFVAEGIRNAMAHATHNHALDKSRLLVAEAFVTPGPMRKKIRYMAKGRAGTEKRRSSHLTIAVRELAAKPTKAPWKPLWNQRLKKVAALNKEIDAQLDQLGWNGHRYQRRLTRRRERRRERHLASAAKAKASAAAEQASA